MTDLSEEAMEWIRREASAIAKFADMNWGDINEQKKMLCFQWAKEKHLREVAEQADTKHRA
jgi:hypothetical protein